VDAEGTAGLIEKAFQITVNTYRLGPRTFFSNDRDPKIPPNLINIIHSIAGLNNFGMLHPNG
jgi:subtilase family serine protease